MKNLLILCGGQSPEHSISIRSTKNILAAIDRSKYSITLVGINQQGEWRLIEENELSTEITDQGKQISIHAGQDQPLVSDGQVLPSFDVAFPILHGPNGEDGTIQGLLKILKIPFVGPGPLSSALCMDKDLCKRILRGEGIGVANWKLLRKGEELPTYREVAATLGSVLFVKPANMGSSVGVHRVSSENEWKMGLEDAFLYDQKVIVEEQVDGRELECAVLGNNCPQASGVGEVQSGEFYSYEEKYESTSQAQTVIPAEIDTTHLPLLKETALKAYQALDCEGMSRVDMFLTREGKVFVNEINTIPGFTNISMYPKLWEQEGISYSALIDKLIDLAIERGV